MTLMMGIMAPILGIVVSIESYITERATSKGLKILGKANNKMEEGISNIRAVKAGNGEKFQASLYSDELAKYFALNKTVVLTEGITTSLYWIAMNSSMVVSVWYAGSLVENSELKVNEMVAFVLTTIDVIESVGEVPFFFGKLTKALSSARRIFPLLERKHAFASLPKDEIKGNITDKAITNTHFQGEIEFKNVSFAYPSRPHLLALRNLSFHLRPGESLGLIGKTGSGKSTIFSLILRFYDVEPNNGQILIDGVDIRKLSIEWVREKVGIVMQSPILFSTSIANNIAYGRSNCRLEEIKEAAKKAHAHEFIKKLPHKYDTHVGQKGVSLSGGQKQRIAIARTMLQKPMILLLDEATSALDSESEQLVQQAVSELMTTTTTITIAHRLKTVSEVDKIVVMKEGEGVESGRRRELERKEGYYSRLYKLETS
eukprot:CAMPEP_0174258808 /NCGR_PEP_ID=MMETSP0439-20130205/7744_1 /TAXON_ID=0 /ORGANISM="Stereomyxa ramosa, Strain Chinc5" /LENGTH=429 /DNA_ID=CAMNT_0015342455 /DNA_START=519 /DNA_END=1808 /DNA_ORIENTATION=-